MPLLDMKRLGLFLDCVQALQASNVFVCQRLCVAQDPVVVAITDQDFGEPVLLGDALRSVQHFQRGELLVDEKKQRVELRSQEETSASRIQWSLVREGLQRPALEKVQFLPLDWELVVEIASRASQLPSFWPFCMVHFGESYLEACDGFQAARSVSWRSPHGFLLPGSVARLKGVTCYGVGERHVLLRCQRPDNYDVVVALPRIEDSAWPGLDHLFSPQEVLCRVSFGGLKRLTEIPGVKEDSVEIRLDPKGQIVGALDCRTHLIRVATPFSGEVPSLSIKVPKYVFDEFFEATWEIGQHATIQKKVGGGVVTYVLALHIRE